ARLPLTSAHGSVIFHALLPPFVFFSAAGIRYGELDKESFRSRQYRITYRDVNLASICRQFRETFLLLIRAFCIQFECRVNLNPTIILLIQAASFSFCSIL